MSTITQHAQMPTEPHWAIVKYSTIHHAGDQRSIDHPGHGYPAYTESIVTYETFVSESAWKDAIQVLESRNTTYSAMKVFPAKIETELVVTVE